MDKPQALVRLLPLPILDNVRIEMQVSNRSNSAGYVWSKSARTLSETGYYPVVCFTHSNKLIKLFTVHIKSGNVAYTYTMRILRRFVLRNHVSEMRICFSVGHQFKHKIEESYLLSTPTSKDVLYAKPPSSLLHCNLGSLLTSTSFLH